MLRIIVIVLGAVLLAGCGGSSNDMTAKEYARAMCEASKSDASQASPRTYGELVEILSDNERELQAMRPPPELQQFHDLNVESIGVMLRWARARDADAMFSESAASRDPTITNAGFAVLTELQALDPDTKALLSEC